MLHGACFCFSNRPSTPLAGLVLSLCFQVGKRCISARIKSQGTRAHPMVSLYLRLTALFASGVLVHKKMTAIRGSLLRASARSNRPRVEFWPISQFLPDLMPRRKVGGPSHPKKAPSAAKHGHLVTVARCGRARANCNAPAPFCSVAARVNSKTRTSWTSRPSGGELRRFFAGRRLHRCRERAKIALACVTSRP